MVKSLKQQNITIFWRLEKCFGWFCIFWREITSFLDIMRFKVNSSSKECENTHNNGLDDSEA